MTITGLCSTWQRWEKKHTCTYDQVSEHLDSETQKITSWETNPRVRETCFLMHDPFSHNMSQVRSIKLEMVVRKNSWLKDRPTEIYTHFLRSPFPKRFPFIAPWTTLLKMFPFMFPPRWESTCGKTTVCKSLPFKFPPRPRTAPLLSRPFPKHFPSHCHHDIRPPFPQTYPFLLPSWQQTTFSPNVSLHIATLTSDHLFPKCFPSYCHPDIRPSFPPNFSLHIATLTSDHLFPKLFPSYCHPDTRPPFPQTFPFILPPWHQTTFSPNLNKSLDSC